jgi:hypothetical protein
MDNRSHSLHCVGGIARQSSIVYYRGINELVAERPVHSTLLGQSEISQVPLRCWEELVWIFVSLNRMTLIVLLLSTRKAGVARTEE